MRSPLVDAGFAYLFSLPRPVRIRIWEWADIMGRNEFDWMPMVVWGPHDL